MSERARISSKKLVERDGINAEWATRRVARKIKHMFDNIEDEYFRERRQDVDYVAVRVVRNLMGQVVDDRLVQDSPLNERNFLSFALLVPGSQLPAEG